MKQLLSDITREVGIFCADLRTMAFYTDFLFTDESRRFKYGERAALRKAAVFYQVKQFDRYNDPGMFHD